MIPKCRSPLKWTIISNHDERILRYLGLFAHGHFPTTCNIIALRVNFKEKLKKINELSEKGLSQPAANYKGNFDPE